MDIPKSSAYISPFMDKCLIGMAGIELSEDIVFPRETACFTTLVAASHAVGCAFTVAYPNGDPRPIPLYAVAEQPSGTSKTRLMRQAYSGYVDRAEMHNGSIEKERRAMKKDINQKKASGMDVNDNQLEMLNDLVDMPIAVTDATPQSLDKVLATTGGTFLAFSTEQTLSDTLLGGMYSDGGRIVDGMINSAFDGESVNSVRASSDRVTFRGKPMGGIYLLSQDGTIGTILASAGRTGLTERFLLLREDDLLGKRDFVANGKSNSDLYKILTGEKEPPKNLIKSSTKKSKLTAFEQLKRCMARMADLRMSYKGKVGFTELPKLTFTEEAWSIIAIAKQYYENKIGEQEARNSFLSSMYAKIDIQMMKVAATLHVCDCDVNQEIPMQIGTEHVRLAFTIVSILFAGVAEIAGSNFMYGEDAMEQFVFDFIKPRGAKGETMEVIKRDVKRKSGDNPFKFYTARGEAFKLIEETVNRLVAKQQLVMMQRGINQPARYAAV